MFKPVFSLVMSGGLIAMIAAPSSIGTVQSAGEFRIDGSTIRRNATLFDGNLVETASARSMIDLSGVQITLLPESRLKVYRDRTVLEKGAGLIRDGETHVMEAASLRISSASRGSLLQVEIAPRNHIAVAARSGSAEVHNQAGLLVARLDTGMALDFDPQAAPATEENLTGVLSFKDGNYFITDETTHVTVEVRGSDLAKFTGDRVQITGFTVPGSSSVTGATQVVQVDSVKRAGKAPGKGSGKGANPGGTAAAGMSTAARGAIIGGVAAGATVLGLAAVGTFSGSSNSRQ